MLQSIGFSCSLLVLIALIVEAIQRLLDALLIILFYCSLAPYGKG